MGGVERWISVRFLWLSAVGCGPVSPLVCGTQNVAAPMRELRLSKKYKLYSGDYDGFISAFLSFMYENR